MADDEQFSLCWNNFNTNLSAGFHESLCRGDLVDVTLAAEGQFVKAHRLVLSVCSPYFRKMFTSMPANQHAFVFLKDVSHSALKDLIQFMYCGEVNVKQDALPAFISTAEALQIKGLTDSDPAPPPVQSPTKPPTPAPQQIPSAQTSPRVKQQRISTSRSYKIETIEDSGDDNKHTQIVLQTTSAPQHIQVQTQPQQHQALIHQQQTTAPSQKRPAQRSVSTPQTKRIKNNVDPLEAVEPNQINVQTVSESKSTTSEHQEIIEFPIDIPTKSEPDYTEDATEVEEGGEQETTYVEEDSYGDMKYDESYFTENDDANQTTGAGATTSGSKQQNTFSDSYVDAADQSATEAQVSNKKCKRGRPKGTGKVKPKTLQQLMEEAQLGPSLVAVYTSTTQGGMKIMYDGHHFKFMFRKGPNTIFQCCWNENNEQCKVRALVKEKRVYHLDGKHTHYGRAVDKSTTSIVTIDTPITETLIVPLIKEFNQDDIAKAKYEDHKIVLLNNIPQTNDNVIDIDKGKGNENEDFMAPEDFKERIKKRLQKALLGKKKS